MKSKLLVAALACLALGACNQDAGKNKDEKKPSAEAPAQGGHTSYDDANAHLNVAAEDQTTSSTDQTTTTNSTTTTNPMTTNPADANTQQNQTTTTTTTTPADPNNPNQGMTTDQTTTTQH